MNLPSVKPKVEMVQSSKIYTGEFGVADPMINGLAHSHVKEIAHPIMASELKYKKNQHQMNMSILRNNQGLHAPLKIEMELKAAKRIGRLPFLPSSHVMLEALTGRDLEIGPEDIFNSPDNMEQFALPHAVVEKSLGLL